MFKNIIKSLMMALVAFISSAQVFAGEASLVDLTLKLKALTATIYC